MLSIVEKAFNWFTHAVFWWGTKGGRTKWMAGRVNYEPDNFSIKIRIAQGSVFSSLLFIIIHQTITKEFKWELPYTGGLVLIAEFVEDLEKSEIEGALKLTYPGQKF